MSERKTPEEIMDELWRQYEAVQRLPTVERQDRSLSLTYRDWMELRRSKYWHEIVADTPVQVVLAPNKTKNDPRCMKLEFCGLPLKIECPTRTWEVL